MGSSSPDGALSDSGVPTDSGLDATDDPPAALEVQLLHIASDRADARFPTLPSRLSRLQLAGAVTLLAVAPGAQQVRFEINGEMRVDDEPPFQWTEDASGSAVPWEIPDEASIRVESTNARGEVTARYESTLQMTRDGYDPSPGDGAHAAHKVWLTESDEYVTRDDAGDFVNAMGEVVLAGSDVNLVTEGNDRGYLVSTDEAPDRLTFAFIVLLPDGYDETIPYPVVVLLHNGWEVYFGTDNDGRVLGLPIVGGENSISNTARRHEFPAIVLIPQLIRSEVVDGVWQQWAAFETITDGNVVRTEDSGYQGDLVIRVLDDLIAQRVDLGGVHTNIDTHRQYLTGHSMGSVGAWDFVARAPERWAAAVTVSGYPDLESAPLLQDESIWAFHHHDDCINPVVGTRAMAQRIQEAGGRLRYTEQDFSGTCQQAHTFAAIEAWKTPELLPWFFSQLSAPR